MRTHGALRTQIHLASGEPLVRRSARYAELLGAPLRSLPACAPSVQSYLTGNIDESGRAFLRTISNRHRRTPQRCVPTGAMVGRGRRTRRIGIPACAWFHLQFRSRATKVSAEPEALSTAAPGGQVILTFARLAERTPGPFVGNVTVSRKRAPAWLVAWPSPVK